MKGRPVWNDAFLVCHEIYQAARELVNSRVPTTQLQSASKFLWRPDLRPRLVDTSPTSRARANGHWMLAARALEERLRHPGAAHGNQAAAPSTKSRARRA